MTVGKYIAVILILTMVSFGMPMAQMWPFPGPGRAPFTASYSPPFAIVQEAALTTDTTHDFTVSGNGTPIGYMMFFTRATANDTSADGALLSIGMKEGSVEQAKYAWSEHGAAANNSGFGGEDLYSGYSRYEGGAFCDYDFDSYITDGVRFDTRGGCVGAVLMTVILINDDNSILDVKASRDSITCASIGTQKTITVSDFRPNAILFTTNSTNTASSANLHASWGAAISDHAATEVITQRMVSTYSDSGADPMANIAYASNTNVGSRTTSNAYNNIMKLEATSTTSGGDFTVECTAATGAALTFNYFAFELAGEYDLVTITEPSGTGDYAITSPGFEPSGMFLGHSLAEAWDTEDLTKGGMSGGVASGTTAYSFSVTDEDGQSTSDTASWSDDIAIHARDDGGSDAFEATHTFTASGVTFNVTNYQDPGNYGWALLIE